MPEQPKQNKKPETKHLNDAVALPAFYTNHTEVTASSNFDIRLRLGQVQEGNDDLIVVKRVADVFMSANHARRIMEQLTQAFDSLDALRPKETK